jgi:methylated-DNA-[protein]-cysteine S-methyltransferase
MDAAGIYARESHALGRYVQIGVAGSKLISVSFPTDPDAGAGTDHPLLDRIADYLDGDPDDFADVDVGLTVPTDQRAVLEELRTVPYGESVTAETLARMTPTLEDLEAGEAVVRTAVEQNPTPLVVPDHRVRDASSPAPEPVTRYLSELEGL